MKRILKQDVIIVVISMDKDVNTKVRQAISGGEHTLIRLANGTILSGGACGLGVVFLICVVA